MLAYAHLLSGETHVTANHFRRIALSLPEAEERAHMNHPDFRVGGKIFATLGYPDKSRGMVKLSPEQQHNFSKDYPGVFVPVKGAWGRRGATNVDLKAADKEHCATRSRRRGATLLPGVSQNKFRKRLEHKRQNPTTRVSAA